MKLELALPNEGARKRGIHAEVTQSASVRAALATARGGAGTNEAEDG
jgi:hypothetical protein